MNTRRLAFLCFILSFSLLFSVAYAGHAQAADDGDAAGSLPEATVSVDSQNTGQDADLSSPGPGFEEFDEFDEFEQPDGGEGHAVFDPLWPYNRAMTWFNDKLYFWVLKPVARGYRAVIPEPARRGIDNFFYNLGFPARFVNNLLQLKFRRAGAETVRFLVNTTVGVAGVWDPAKAWLGIPAYPEDFGQTLGRYGVGGGFHIVLPVFGPSNLRDAVGRVADAFLDPVNYLSDTDEIIAARSFETINHTSLHVGEYEALTSGALDLYIFLRDGYEQYRAKEIKE